MQGDQEGRFCSGPRKRLCMTELEVERDEASVTASLLLSPTPRITTFSLLWGCLKVNLI